MKITLLDLFSGMGGFHKGLEQAGFEVESYFSEIDKYAIQVYQNNFKKSKYVGSVKMFTEETYQKLMPSLSEVLAKILASQENRKGMEGDRSSLIGEAIRLVSECRPKFFVWENVKGTFSSNNGEDFWAIIQAFANIGGYRFEWQLLNTKWFLPQNRERIYLVGYIENGGGDKYFLSEKNKRKVDVLQGQQGSYVIERQLDAQEEVEIGDSINYSVPNSKTKRGRVGKGVAQTLDTACNQAVLQTEYKQKS